MAINSIHELIPSHLTTKRPAQIKFYFFRKKKFTIGIGARKYVDFYLFFTGKPPLARMDSKKFGRKITIQSDLKTSLIHLALIGIYILRKIVSNVQLC